jgi:hypothetical protein
LRSLAEFARHDNQRLFTDIRAKLSKRFNWPHPAASQFGRLNASGDRLAEQSERSMRRRSTGGERRIVAGDLGFYLDHIGSGDRVGLDEHANASREVAPKADQTP